MTSQENNNAKENQKKTSDLNLIKKEELPFLGILSGVLAAGNEIRRQFIEPTIASVKEATGPIVSGTVKTAVDLLNSQSLRDEALKVGSTTINNNYPPAEALVTLVAKKGLIAHAIETVAPFVTVEEKRQVFGHGLGIIGKIVSGGLNKIKGKGDEVKAKVSSGLDPTSPDISSTSDRTAPRERVPSNGSSSDQDGSGRGMPDSGRRDSTAPSDVNPPEAPASSSSFSEAPASSSSFTGAPASSSSFPEAAARSSSPPQQYYDGRPKFDKKNGIDVDIDASFMPAGMKASVTRASGIEVDPSIVEEGLKEGLKESVNEGLKEKLQESVKDGALDGIKTFLGLEPITWLYLALLSGTGVVIFTFKGKIFGGDRMNSFKAAMEDKQNAFEAKSTALAEKTATLAQQDQATILLQDKANTKLVATNEGLVTDITALQTKLDLLVTKFGVPLALYETCSGALSEIIAPILAAGGVSLLGYRQYQIIKASMATKEEQLKQDVLEKQILKQTIETLLAQQVSSQRSSTVKTENLDSVSVVVIDLNPDDFMPTDKVPTVVEQSNLTLEDQLLENMKTENLNKATQGKKIK